MKRYRIGLLLHLVMIAAWMGIIFYLSHQQGSQSDHVSGSLMEFLLRLLPLDLETMAGQGGFRALHSALRTLAHFGEYAVLGILVCSFALRCAWSRPWLLSMLAGAVYAASDEWHQYFVPGRACQLQDWMVDVLGCLFGVLLVLLCGRISGRIRDIRSQNAERSKNASESRR